MVKKQTIIVKKQTKNDVMTPEEIQVALKRKGFNYSMIAEATNVTPAHVRNVAKKIFISRRVAKAIAAAVERPFDKVFPEYAEKTPRGRSERRKKAVASLKKKIETAQAVN